MVAVPLLAIAAAGLIAGVVKVVHHNLEKHNLLKPRNNHQAKNNSSEESRELSTLLTANILINGKSYKFVKDTSQTFAHYDLAIDYCTANAKELGLSVESIKTCIYPLSNIINQEFQELVASNKQTKSLATIADRTPKELVIAPPVNALPSQAESTSNVESIQTNDQSQESLNTGNAVNSRSNEGTIITDDLKHQIILEINGINYVFEYLLGMDPVEASVELANNFCVAKGMDLLKRYFEINQVTDEQKIQEALYNKCYLPLQGSILTKINEESENAASPTSVIA